MKHSVLLLFLLPALLGAGDLLRIEDSVEAMGTTYTVVAFGEGQQHLEQAVEATFTEARRLDRMLSNYKRESEWSEVNRNAAEHPVKVTPELFELLEACEEYSRQSEGTFDIAVGPLMKIWGFYKSTGRVPSKEEVAAVLPAIDYRNIVLDKANQTVSFRRPGVEIDPGGIGKGYAVDRMVGILRQKGIHSALISAGGSSIYALGAPPSDSSGWTVKIRNPRVWTDTVQDVYLKNESMSTSGGYEKFFEVNGKVYSHIMDPRTGYPSSGVLSVSVIAPKTLDSEAWTKPFFVLGRQWAAQHKPKGLRVYFCEDRTELACAWLQ